MMFYTYQYYVDNIMDEDLLEVDCGNCDGTGYEECNLGHEHECEDCDGEGKVEADVRTQYHDAVIRDIVKYAAWVGKPEVETALRAEFKEKYNKLSYSREIKYL